MACHMGFRKGYTPWNKGLTGVVCGTKKGTPSPRKGIKTGFVPRTAFQKGEASPFKGKVHTVEARIKNSEAHKGKMLGEKHPNWKGGLRGINYLERRRFQGTMQKQIFERDDYTCQICGARGVDIQVDHIQSWAEYVELRFSMDNCRTLCAKCHYKITFGRPMPENVKAWGHNLIKGGNIQ